MVKNFCMCSSRYACMCVFILRLEFHLRGYSLLDSLFFSGTWKLQITDGWLESEPTGSAGLPSPVCPITTHIFM